MKSKYLLIIVLLLNMSDYSFAQNIKISGAMSNVMKKGQLEGTIHLDTISNKKSLYGLGPNEYLKGELLIIDGKSYLSTVDKDGSIKMEETYNVNAPFFVYGNNEKWQKKKLPKTIKTIKQLEEFIDRNTQNIKRPFVFKLEGTFSKIDFHIQNLPEGTVVKSPKDAHTGQGKYTSENTKGEIIGFFSTEHQTIFTHHDTYIHMHYINAERTEMGHIDDLYFNGNVNIYLPIK